MKKILAIILALSAMLVLCACKPKSNQNDTDTSNDKIIKESYMTQLEYYIELVQSLQNEIMEEKESNFIAECAYRLKIEELEDEILSLKKHGSFVNVDSDNSNDPPNESDNHEETPKQFEETAVAELFEFEIINRKLTVANYLGDGGEVEIPQKIDGVAVKAIGEEAFKGADATKIIIPDGVESIGWFAFSGCRSLREINIPSTVTSVEYGAFDYCSPSLVIICEKGSYIEAYAKSWGIKVIAE